MESQKATRGSISVRGTTYLRIQEHCKNHGLSVGAFVSQLLTAELDAKEDGSRREPPSDQ